MQHGNGNGNGQMPVEIPDTVRTRTLTGANVVWDFDEEPQEVARLVEAHLLGNERFLELHLDRRPIFLSKDACQAIGWIFSFGKHAVRPATSEEKSAIRLAESRGR